MNTLNTNPGTTPSQNNTNDSENNNNGNNNSNNNGNNNGNNNRNNNGNNNRNNDNYNDIIRLNMITYSRFLESQQDLIGQVLRQVSNLSQQYYNISTDIMRHARNLRNRNNRIERSTFRNDNLFMPFSTPINQPLTTPIRHFNRPPTRTRGNTRRARRVNTLPVRNIAQSPMIGRALYSAPISFTPFSTSRLTTNQILDSTTNLTLEEAQNRNALMCPISHENFDASSNIVMINHCCHVFARNNLYRWFETHSSCPICRYDLLNPSGTQTQTSSGTQTQTSTGTQTQTTGRTGSRASGFQASIDISPINIFNDDVLNTFTNSLANSVANSLNNLTMGDASNNLFGNNIFSDTSDFSMPLFNSSIRAMNTNTSTQTQTTENEENETSNTNSINETNETNQHNSETQTSDDILNDEFENFNFDD